MRGLLATSFLVITITLSYGQYWFGPKVGFSYIEHNYKDENYKDTFQIENDFNFQAGAAFSYTATDRYSVYGELVYERVSKSLKDRFTDGDNVKAEMTNHFISVPVMLRITLGKVPFHYFINGGPSLRYWLGGNGTHDLASFEEFLIDENGDPLVVDYKLTFNSDNSSPGDFSTAFVDEPNRVQFGLTLGAGAYFDLASGGRLQLDFRYTWVHSNMASNSPDDTNLIRGSPGDLDFYRENMEYYNNIATIGLAYLFGYDANLKRKGRSTNKESNKKKK